MTNSALTRVRRTLERALYAVGGVTVLAMMVYIVANALSRTLFRYPFPASLEIVQYLMMPGLACLGFIAATLARRHVVADIIFDKFPAIGRKWLVVVNSVLCVVTLAVLVWFSWRNAVFAFERGFKAGFTDIPAWPLYFAIPVSLLICAALFAYDAWIQSRIAAGEEHVREEGSYLDDSLTEDQQELLAQARASGEVI
ncbi:MAG: TRAP transporter small permease [Microbacterium sp.]